MQKIKEFTGVLKMNPQKLRCGIIKDWPSMVLKSEKEKDKDKEKEKEQK